MPELQELNIKDMIYTIRGQQIMLDSDLARLYGYDVKALNQQVKRNIERFPSDFMFRLNREEVTFVKSQFVTSRNGFFEGQEGGNRKLPYAFTEQGIYMLSTVLKGELAVNQSIAIMRAFKKMRHYILENQLLIGSNEIAILAIQTNQNTNRIVSIEHTMATKEDIVDIKSDISQIMNNFIDDSKIKEFVFIDGQKFEADEAYISIYKQAKKSIYVVDDYVSIKTLSHLKHKNTGVNVVLFTDNKSNRDKLQQVEVTVFNNEYPLLEVRETNGMVHDRLIVLDYGTNDERIYLCGASSKDAGAKFCTILEVHDTSNYHTVINNLLLNKLLVL